MWEVAMTKDTTSGQQYEGQQSYSGQTVCGTMDIVNTLPRTATESIANLKTVLPESQWNTFWQQFSTYVPVLAQGKEVCMRPILGTGGTLQSITFDAHTLTNAGSGLQR